MGLDKAKADLGVEFKEATQVNGESEAATEERLQQFIDAGATHVIGVGFAYAKAIGTVAKANPDVKFAIIDDASPDSAGPNVAQLTFAEEQGSFLVGAAAALKSKTNTVGFVGGVATDLIKKFEAGYIAGAKAANPSIIVKSQYLSQPPDFSGFNDPAKGKTAAEGLYQGGADVVYHAAGGSGSGVFTAAKAAGKLAIGVDSDQALTATPDVRDVILTSMIKKVDVAVYDFLKAGAAGTDITGNKVFDLKAGGVDYATTGGKVDDIKTKLDDYKAEDHLRRDHGPDRPVIRETQTTSALTPSGATRPGRRGSVVAGRVRPRLRGRTGRPSTGPHEPPARTRSGPGRGVVAITAQHPSDRRPRCGRPRRRAGGHHQALPRSRGQQGHRLRGPRAARSTRSSVRTAPASRR